MSTAKVEVQELLNRLPDECTLEDVQYHLYVLEKIHQGIKRADSEGVISQDAAEKRLEKWTIDERWAIGVEERIDVFERKEIKSKPASEIFSGIGRGISDKGRFLDPRSLAKER